ncbi:hypothetical protein FRB99_008052 [Tulasnella sp. 403]|nr:hypothetical protein FRB99_008052 [Tulasnella sp. 403]
MTEEGDPTNHASSPSLGGELSASNDDEGYLADNDTLSTSGTNENSGRASPNSSKAPTIRSYSSSIDRDALLHDVHGRTVNRTSNHYMLPADEAEHSRLDIQHEMLRLKMDGLFFRPDVVKQILAPRRNPVPAVLDIGTGSGSWVVDMAKAFPHARVVGLDLVPANLSSYVTTSPLKHNLRCPSTY